MSAVRRAVCVCLAVCFFFPAGYPAYAASPLAERLAGKRFSATRVFGDAASREDAVIVAETAASAEAMHYALRLLITLPEVRMAGETAVHSAGAPNLLALAHASLETEVMLISRSRKDASVTVTVTFGPPEKNAAAEQRVREALLFPERLAFYEETALREKTLCNAYTAALQTREGEKNGTGQTARDIARELSALKMFKDLLPRWNGIWQSPEDAAAVLLKALQLAPASPLLRNAAGDAALQLGRSQEALEQQTAAIREDPAFARAYHSRGAAHLALGHLALAVADFSEAVRLAPATPSYRRSRGMARYMLGETAAMCADFYEACVLGDCEKFHWSTERALCTASPF